MITIKIGSDEVTLEQADEGWINQQINRRRRESVAVCVQVNIQEPDVRMTLSTPTCSVNGGGGRAPNQRERRIFDLWNERGLNQQDFMSGAVIAFLHQLRRLL